MRSLTLRKRIILPLIMAGLVIFGIGSYFVGKLETRQKQDAIMQEAEAIQSHIHSALETKAEVMEASLHFIAQNKQLLAALQAGDRKALLALGTPVYRQLNQKHNVTHFYFHDAHRINLLRIHKPEKFGDPIDRYTALGAEKRAALFSGIELGPLGTFTLRSVLPVFNDGQLAGYIELGQEIDDLIQESHSMFHVELFMLVDKRYLVQREWESGMRMLARPFDWNKLSTTVLVSQSMQDTPIETLNQITTGSDIHIRKDIDLQAHRYWAGIIPVKDAGDRQVATLVTLHDMTHLIEHSKKDLSLFAGIYAITGLSILILFYLILGRIEQELTSSRQKLITESKSREEMQGRFILELQNEQLKLYESEEKFEKISASAQDAILCMDNEGNISFWNKAAETIFGYTQAEVLGKNLHDLIVPTRFHEAHLKAFPEFQKTGEGAALGKTLEMAAIRKGGMEFPVEMALSSTLIAGKWHGIGVLRDISTRKKDQLEIQQALHIQRVLDSILNISLPPLTLKEVLLASLDVVLSIPAFSLLNKGAIFLVVDGEQKLEMVAQRGLPDALLQSCATLPFGRCLCGKAAATREIVFFNQLNDQHEIRYEGIQPHGHYCIPIMSDGLLLGVLNAYVAAGHVSDEVEKRFLKTVADTLAVVIERKLAEEKLQQLAHNDPLTGLPNRALFHDRLEQGLALAQRHKLELAVLFLDLDHFKEINDTLGHDMGDALLKETANRLLACVRKTDTVARMGGDEFTVILTEMKAPESAEQIAKSILKALLKPFELNGTSCQVGCSIGIARYPEHGMDSETLLKHADTAMYHAKRKRNTFCCFNKVIQAPYLKNSD
ncbi:MAG: diguanylate cyclase [Gallionellales bacterium RIFOXYB12_FULL_54_9]|nr:MAG: diguanylate cyclase [Gallionellales bacterium RIFOXYB12_FULL_54_9]